METFTFQPNWGMSLSRKPELMKNSFGDGYEQIRPKGLNHNLRTYSATFTGAEERIKQIDAFFERHGGYQAFNWTPYGGKAGKFRCEEWEASISSGKWTLSATIREVIL